MNIYALQKSSLEGLPFIFTWKGRKIKSEIKNVFIADIAIIMVCEIEIFIEMSISVRNMFRTVT